MAASAPLKKLPNIKERMVLADPIKEANNGEKNERPVATPLFKYSDTLF